MHIAKIAANWQVTSLTIEHEAFSSGWYTEKYERERENKNKRRNRWIEQNNFTTSGSTQLYKMFNLMFIRHHSRRHKTLYVVTKCVKFENLIKEWQIFIWMNASQQATVCKVHRRCTRSLFKEGNKWEDLINVKLVVNLIEYFWNMFQTAVAFKNLTKENAEKLSKLKKIYIFFLSLVSLYQMEFVIIRQFPRTWESV